MSIANLNTDDSDLVEDEQYVLDGKGLREKLLDIVAEQEEYVKKVSILVIYVRILVITPRIFSFDV